VNDAHTAADLTRNYAPLRSKAIVNYVTLQLHAVFGDFRAICSPPGKIAFGPARGLLKFGTQNPLGMGSQDRHVTKM
jgi:hypothetical protein